MAFYLADWLMHPSSSLQGSPTPEPFLTLPFPASRLDTPLPHALGPSPWFVTAGATDGEQVGTVCFIPYPQFLMQYLNIQWMKKCWLKSNRNALISSSIHLFYVHGYLRMKSIQRCYQNITKVSSSSKRVLGNRFRFTNLLHYHRNLKLKEVQKRVGESPHILLY